MSTVTSEDVTGQIVRCRACDEPYMTEPNDDGYCASCLPPTEAEKQAKWHDAFIEGDCI